MIFKGTEAAADRRTLSSIIKHDVPGGTSTQVTVLASLRYLCRLDTGNDELNVKNYVAVAML